MKSSFRNSAEVAGFLVLMGAIITIWLISKYMKTVWVFVGGSVIADKCGHPACRTEHMSKRNRKGAVREWTLQMPISANGGVDWCPRCIEDMTPLCPWCGEPIAAGTPITLYSPPDPHFVIPKWTVVYSRKPLRLVGCGGMHCAESGVDYCGWWEPGDGGDPVLKRYPSGIEIAVAAFSGKPVTAFG